jgi:hypothetical protein
MTVNRCNGFNSRGKKCRTRIENNQLFCCEQHKPLNYSEVIDECPICYAKINKESNQVYILRCSHMFHYSCIQQWFNKDNTRRMCPMCRQDVSPPEKKYKSIFD